MLVLLLALEGKGGGGDKWWVAVAPLAVEGGGRGGGTVVVLLLCGTLGMVNGTRGGRWNEQENREEGK